MTLKFPESMDECVYFTRRKIDNGSVVAWVFREKCPVCHKSLMSKPKDEKTGKAKIRADEYICPDCNHTVPKQEYEDTLTCSIQYTCPECMNTGEVQVPFKRKTYKGASSVLFECEKCKAKIAITKKNEST